MGTRHFASIPAANHAAVVRQHSAATFEMDLFPFTPRPISTPPRTPPLPLPTCHAAALLSTALAPTAKTAHVTSWRRGDLLPARTWRRGAVGAPPLQSTTATTALLVEAARGSGTPVCYATNPAMCQSPRGPRIPSERACSSWEQARPFTPRPLERFVQRALRVGGVSTTGPVSNARTLPRAGEIVPVIIA